MLAVAAALVLAPAAALAHGSAASSNSQTFADSTGENPNAPDITSIVVSNDDAGLITFKVNISNRPTLTQDMFVIVYLNTDKQTSTGDSQNDGADYALEVDPGSVTLYKWNGTDYVSASSQTSVTYSYDSTGATIHASSADLGGTKSFLFFAIAVSGVTNDSSGNADFSKAQGDSAPDVGHGDYAYDVLTKLTLSVAGFTTSPKPARAGKAFAAGLAANESDTGGPVKSGTVTCSATIAGKHLTAKAAGVVNGVAVCAWTLPKKVKGTLTGTVSLTVQGTTVTKSFAVAVKL